MTENRIIEMAIKPPFKYFVQKDRCFGGGPLPEELCFNSLSKAKETCEKLWLENKILTSIFRVYYIDGDWQQRAGWLCDRILTMDVDCNFIRQLNDLQIHVAFLWNYHVRKWNPKLYDKIKEVAYRRLKSGTDDTNDWEEIKQELGLGKKQVRKDTVKDTFKNDVKQLCKKVEKQFDKFILANEELTLCVQKKYPKIRAEYAVFDRMVMFTEEHEKGYAGKEFQTLEEVEEYYREKEMKEIKNA